MNANVIESTIDIEVGTEKQESDITMKYTFRKLNSTDLFLMFKIIGKIGIKDFINSFDKDTLKNIGGLSKGEENTTLAGISIMLEVVNVLVSNLPKCEVEIYQMLANVSNLSVKQIREMDFATFTEMVIDFVKKEEFKDFIKVVLKSFKPMN